MKTDNSIEDDNDREHMELAYKIYVMKTDNSIEDDNDRDPMGLIFKFIMFAMTVIGGITCFMHWGDIEHALGGMVAGFIIGLPIALVLSIFLAPFVALYDFLRHN